jgi:hypothetical protein
MSTGEVKPDGAGFDTAERPARRAVVPVTTGWRTGAVEASRRRLVVGTVLVLFAAVGAIAGLLLLVRRPVEPLFVSIPIGEYADPAWPVNPWADQDADLLVPRFAGHGPEPGGLKAFSYQQSDRLRALLAWVAGKSDAGADLPADRHRPLILHVTALAAVRDGRVYLLAGDARPEEPPSPTGGWMDVSEVLSALNAWPARHKLLILDLAHPAADPFGGHLRDDAAARLDDLLRAKPPEFPVLTSCGPGERSLPADAARSSAFALYLADGLGGAADGYGPSATRDGDVSVREVAAFAAARVDRWARTTHGRRQVPTLYGSGDFVLARRPQWHGPPPEPPATYPDWLRDAWGEAAGRGPGVPTARLKAGLLLAEECWRHPGPARRAEDVWAVTRDEFAAARVAAPPPAIDWTKLDGVADRLAVARLGKPTPSPELTKALDGFLVAKPEQAAEAEKAWAAAARPAPDAAVQVVWALARDTDRPTVEMVSRWATAASVANPVKPFAETRLLVSLAERGSFRRQKLATFPSLAVAALIRAEDDLGTITALGPDGFPAGREHLTAALSDYRTGRDLLFAADSGEKVATTLATLDRARARFALARSQVERTRDARRALDAAALALGDTLPGMIEFGRPAPDAWNALADTAARVASVEPTAADPQDVAALPKLTAAVRFDLDAKEYAAIAGRGRRPDPANGDRLRAFLSVSAVNGPARQQAWNTLLIDSAALHAAVREKDDADDADRVLTAVPVPTVGADSEMDRALRRAEASVRLLRLAGSPVAGRASELLRAARGGDRTGWDRLGAHFQTAWLNELPTAARSPTPAAERTQRAVTPALARYRAWSGRFPTPPHNDLHAYQEWAAQLARPVVQGGAP